MNINRTLIGAAAIAILASFPLVSSAQTSGDPRPPAGQTPAMAQRWPMFRGAMPGIGSMPRHHLAMMWGIPAPYNGLTNPLPRTNATVDWGANVYAQNCVSCHGATGQGDGEAGRALSPPPGNLAWLSQMPMSRWDAFMYWTVAEGGAPLGTAMPTFKQSLSKEDIWAVIAYVQARLPQKAQ